MAENLKNILIIKPSSLGDIVQALPALSALRRTFPDATITWLIRPEFAKLIENHPHLNDIILFDRKFLGKAWHNPRAFAALLSLIKQLRRNKFDTVLDLQGLFRTAALAWLTGCKKRFGMKTAREFAHIFYNQKVPQDARSIHVVDYYLKVVKAVGVSDLAVEFIFPQNPAAADSVSALLIQQNITQNNYAVFIPGSAQTDKCWPIERFAALADKLADEFGFAIVATGTQSEKPIAEKFKTLTSAPVANLAGQTNLPQLTALLSTAKLVLSNDTGPGHVAAALGTPLAMIFGWANPIRIFPYKRSDCVVAVDPFTRDPKQLRSPDPKHDVTAITIEQVYTTVCQQLEQES